MISVQIQGVLKQRFHVFGLKSKNEWRLLRELDRIRKRAGKVRDMDVLIGYVLAAPVDGEQYCLVQLLVALGENRARNLKKLRVTVATLGPDLRRHLKRSATKIESLLDQAQDGSPGTGPYSEVTAAALGLSEELKLPARLNKGNLHPYRLKVKELRCTLELATEANQQEFVKSLGEVKDAIGEWHDWQELVKLAERKLDHGRKCKLLPKLRSIRETKFNEALVITSRMRQKFLPPGPRIHIGSQSHKKSLTPSSVLSAVSAMSA